MQANKLVSLIHWKSVSVYVRLRGCDTAYSRRLGLFIPALLLRHRLVSCAGAAMRQVNVIVPSHKGDDVRLPACAGLEAHPLTLLCGHMCTVVI